MTVKLIIQFDANNIWYNKVLARFALVLLLISCFSSLGVAQVNESGLKYFLDLAKLQYSKPTNYKEMAPSLPYSPVNSIPSSTMIYNLEDANKGICINIWAFPMIPTSKAQLPFMIALHARDNDGEMVDSTYFAVNNHWKWQMEKIHDTSKGPAVFLKRKMLRKINANIGVVFPLKIDNPYKGIYDQCKELIISRNDVGFAEIQFFYNDQSAKAVDDEIKNTWGMLTFEK